MHSASPLPQRFHNIKCDQFSCKPTHICRPIARHAANIRAQSQLNTDAAIGVRGLQLSFGGGGSRKQVLAGVDVDVPRGSFHMLLGANGCGKSTLLRVIAGLLTPDIGSVHVDAPYGFVFQNPDHQVVLPTVAADVAFGLGRYKLTPDEVSAAVHHALDRVGLATVADRPTSSLSGGQKQRVAIAGALAENPRVLLLDELTTFLDGRDQRNVLECVRDIVDASNTQNTASGEGEADAEFDNPVTALWVTHRLEELEYADGVSVMDGGRVIFRGTPQDALKIMRKMGANV